MIDVTSLVQNAVGRNYRYLSLLLKGSHARRESESNPNPTVGPQDQYVGFTHSSPEIMPPFIRQNSTPQEMK